MKNRYKTRETTKTKTKQIKENINKFSQIITNLSKTTKNN